MAGRAEPGLAPLLSGALCSSGSTSGPLRLPVARVLAIVVVCRHVEDLRFHSAQAACQNLGELAAGSASRTCDRPCLMAAAGRGAA